MMLKSAVLFVLLSVISFKVFVHYFSIVIDLPENEYDFIVVGGGTTGAVVANRLSENGKFKVLVLEAGAEDGYNPIHNIPLLNPLNVGGSIDWNLQTESLKSAAKLFKNNSIKLMRGKSLGGTSMTNFQLYVRGSASDYDSWAAAGADGWNYDSILPYFLKSESSQHMYPVDENYHGKDGYIKVNHQQKAGITEALFKAAEELGIKYIDDHNTNDILGIAPIQTTSHKGIRQSSSKAYLHSVAHSRRDHLHIVTDAHVMKIVTQKRSDGAVFATGVVFSKNGERRTVNCRREVILSSGVFGTPQLLMLSGIGPKEHLKKHHIDVVADLPAVGSNYQDHVFVPFYFHGKNLSFGDVHSVKEIIYSLPGWLWEGTGPLGTNGGAIARLKFQNKEHSTSKGKSPDIEVFLVPVAADVLMFKLIMSSWGYRENVFDYGYGKAYNERDGQLFSYLLFSVLLHPKSKGTVRLKSNDPFDQPIIDTNIFSHPDDLDTMAKGVKWIFDTATTDALREKQISHVSVHNKCGKDDQRSEDYYKCLVLADPQLYHGCCTARMGRHGDINAVVDPQLRVYGVGHLRIADASVWPHHISGAPQATCYMLGERAASLIKESYSVT